jgi:hypothetical protein
VFALGAAAGAGVVGSVSSAASPSPNLVAGNGITVNYDPMADDSIAVSIDIYNASDHDLTALPTLVAGWAVAGDEPAPQVLFARSWTALSVSALPVCDEPLTDVVVIEADATQYQVATGPHLVEQLSYLRQNYCGLGSHVFIEPEPVSTSVEADALRMDLRMPAHRRPMLGEQLITGALSQTPGFTAEADGVPATLTADEPLAVSVLWQIQDCQTAAESVTGPSIAFTTDDDVVVESWLGDRGVALLARYVATQCGA